MTYSTIARLSALTLLLLTLVGTAEAQVTVFLDQTFGDDANDGLGWVSAYRSFAALKDRIAADTEVTGVNIAAGWYQGNITLDRPFTFIGGFSPGGGEFSLWRFKSRVTGDGEGPVFRFLPGSSGNLLGLIIRGGHATNEPIAGGVTAIGAPLSLAWCIVENNVGCRGGGVHFDTRGTTITARMTNTIVRNNVALCDTGTGLGGGAYILVDEAASATPPVIADCRVENNRAAATPLGTMAAGGAHVEGNVSIEGSSFVGNEGAGLVLSSGINPIFDPAAAVKACVFAHNSTYGAAIACPGTYPLSQSTFSGNASGGIGSYQYPAPDVRTDVSLHGSIVWQQPAELFVNVCDAAVLSVTDSLIEGGFPMGVGILDLDPQFVTGPRGHFYLPQLGAGDAMDSPALDAGPEDAMDVGMHLRTTRVDSDRDMGVVDLGAHYFVSDFVEGPGIAIDRYEDLTMPTVLVDVARFPFLDEPGLLSDGTRPLLYYRVSHVKVPLLVSKDLATDSILLSY